MNPLIKSFLAALFIMAFAGIFDASMSIAEAKEMRVLRIYGEPNKEALF